MSRLTDEEWAAVIERMKIFRDQMVQEFGCSSIVIAAACECDVDGAIGNSHRITSVHSALLRKRRIAL